MVLGVRCATQAVFDLGLMRMVYSSGKCSASADPVSRGICCCVLAVALLHSGCVTAPHASSAGPPGWWDDFRETKGVDALYFRAKGESRISEEAARADARDWLHKHVADYIGTNLAVKGAGTVKDQVLREIEIFREHSGRTVSGRWIVYMAARYPLEQYERVKKRIELGIELDEHWAAAQSCANREQFDKAHTIFSHILDDYDRSLSPSFDIEEVKMARASLYLKQDYVVKARRWAEDVQKSSTAARWREVALEFIASLPPLSLKDIFGDGKVALYCCESNGTAKRACPGLLAEVNGRMLGQGIRTVDISGMADNALFASTFESGRFGAHCRKAEALGADAVLAVLLDIDPAKTGKTQTLFDVECPLLDARLSFYVVDVKRQKVVYSSSGDPIKFATNGNLRNTYNKTVAAMFQRRKNRLLECPPLSD